MKHDVTLSEITDFSVLNIVANIWDYVTTQLNRIYDKGQDRTL